MFGMFSTIQNSPIKVPSKSKKTQRWFFEYPLLGGKYVFEAQDNPFFWEIMNFKNPQKRTWNMKVLKLLGELEIIWRGKHKKTFSSWSSLCFHEEFKFGGKHKRKQTVAMQQLSKHLYLLSLCSVSILQTSKASREVGKIIDSFVCLVYRNSKQITG